MNRLVARANSVGQVLNVATIVMAVVPCQDALRRKGTEDHQEYQANKAIKANKVFLVWKAFQVQREVKVIQDHKEPEGQKVIGEKWVCQVSLESMEYLVCKDPQECMVFQDWMVAMELM